MIIYSAIGFMAIVAFLWIMLLVTKSKLAHQKRETEKAQVQAASATFKADAISKTQRAVRILQEKQKAEQALEEAKIAAGDRSALDRDD